MENPNRKKHTCSICGLDFALNASLKLHVQKRHSINSSNGSDDDSGVSSSSDHSEIKDLKPNEGVNLERIKQHLAERLPQIDEVKTSNHSGEHFHSLPAYPSENFCKCLECNKIFDSQDKLVQHQRSKNHEGKETIETTKMTKSASVPGVNAAHLKTFTCAFCARSFDNAEKLAQHNTSEGHLAKLKEKTARIGELSNLGNEPNFYFCNYPDCGKVFNDRYKLSQHQLMKKHSVVLQSSGPTVDEKLNTFPRQEAITEVERIDFVATESVGAAAPAVSYRILCDQCEEFNEASRNKNFIFLTFIAKHYLKKHAPENYVRGYCPICNQKMEKTKNLLVHIARVHLLQKFKDEACCICLRLCKDRNDLQEHTTSVHRYKCLMDECSSMFASKTLRDKHMLQKHGVHVCNREDCHSIFTSIDEKIRHINQPHPTTDSDSGLSSVYSHEAVRNRIEIERGAFSEPTLFNDYRTTENQYPYSADELSNNSLELQDSSQNAAYKLFRNHMQFLKNTLKELKEPLKRPVNPLCVDEALNLCNEVMGDLSEIRDHYRRSRHRHFDIDLIGK